MSNRKKRPNKKGARKNQPAQGRGNIIGRDKVGRDSVGRDKFEAEHITINHSPPFQVTNDEKIQEFTAVLKERADTILFNMSKVEDEAIIEYRNRFIDLHKRHLESLIKGEFIRAHEIARWIVITLMRFHAKFPGVDITFYRNADDLSRLLEQPKKSYQRVIVDRFVLLGNRFLAFFRCR
jgi:hypothetical protein